MSSAVAYAGDGHAVLAACRDLIAAAERSIVLQMYLFAGNGDQTLLLPRAGAFPYAETVAAWLIEKRRARPDVTVVVVLDSNTPANPALTRRRGELVRDRLARAGVIVLTACLFHARFDPRPRRVLRRMNLHLSHAHVALPDWVEHQNRWQVLHNVEDHRKNLVIDGGRAGFVTSHNFIDPAFDWHENLFWLTGDAARALFAGAAASITAALAIPQSLSAEDRATLAALARTPAPNGHDRLAPTHAPVAGYDPFPTVHPPVRTELVEEPACALIEHESIRTRLIAMFDAAVPGDALLVATTYYSDQETLAALARAAERGVRVRVLIDSIHALPLPPLAAWLTRALVNHEVVTRATALHARLGDAFELRVHDSRAGAMMHLKTAARVGARPMLIGGQANYTPNSFSGAWLETCVETRAPAVITAFETQFEHLWSLPDARRPEAPRGVRARLAQWVRSALLRLFALVGIRP